MNYIMLQRELRTLSEDLGQMAEGIISPEPPKSAPEQPVPGRMALPTSEVRAQLEYVKTKIEATIELTKEPKYSALNF